MIQPAALYLWGSLELFFLCNFASSNLFDGATSYTFFDYPPVVYTYSRLSEIEKECSPFLSSASNLKQDDGRGYRIKKELSFFEGDWVQELGESPLVPFDDSDLPKDHLPTSSPLRLVGFEVKDVNPVHLLKNAVSLCGTMCIGMARNSTLVYDSRSTFYMTPGMSVLKIGFEGVYMESEKNGGQRLLCMLGNTSLPLSKPVDEFLDKPSNDDYSFSSSNLRLLQDGRLLLVLRYPQILSLTKRAILGELRSLNEPGKRGYFGAIHINSQLNRFSRYEFMSSELLKSKTCNFSLYLDELEEDGANTFYNSEICTALRGFSGTGFKIAPNWRFASRGLFRSFFSGQETNKSIERSYQNVSLIMQNIICECDQETDTEIMRNSARVAGVLRAVPSGMEQDTAAMMTGLSGTTLSVEGTWDASKGQLCMVGCPGVVNSGLEGCDSRVSLYFPRSFSIKQRSIIYGSISSLSSPKSNSYDPMLFDVTLVRPIDIWFDYYPYLSYLSYNYSKIELARAVRERNQPAGFIGVIKRLFMSYPGGRSLLARVVSEVKQFFLTHYLAFHRDEADSLSHLEVRDLSFSCYGIPIPSYPNCKPETFMKLEVLALGPLASGHDRWSHYDRRHPSEEDQFKMSKSGVLNISLSVMFTEGPLELKTINYRNISSLFLEGQYDSVTGQMYLIGCRKITDHHESLNLNLERGLDCLIEVKIAYPPETMRWLINPRASLTISSQRSEEDTLFFQTIKLRTSDVFRFGNYEMDAVLRKLFEEILRNLMIAASIGLISSQLLYMKENVDGIPYISRIMLSFQCLGYVFPLISSNHKVLLQEKEYQSPRNLYGHEHTLTLLDYSEKLLCLAAFVLAVILSRKVAEFRKKPHLHLPSHSNGVPSDKKVRSVTAAVLVVGYFVYCYIFGAIGVGDAQLKNIWTEKTQEFVCLVQDLFLLPQIIENMKWEVNFRPLRKLYYVGFTMMRLGLHLYDYVRYPLIDPYSGDPAPLNHQDLFFSSTAAPKLAVGVIMAGLAVVLYIQQKDSQEKLIKQRKTISAKSR